MEIFTVNNPLDLVSKDPDIQKGIADFHKEMNQPRFHIKDVGVSSKLIGDWTKAGLLNDEFQKGKWRQFSFLEAIWVKFIEELRFFGMTVEEIKELKESLFPTKGEAMKTLLTTLASADAPAELKDTQDQFKKYLADSDEEIQRQLDGSNFSVFASIITNSLIANLNISYLMDARGGCFINLSKPNDQYHAKTIEEVFRNVHNKSFAVINVKSLIAKFFDNEKLVAGSDFYFSIMDKDEREVIQAIRSGNYKQITIKMEDGSITQLRLGKKQDEDLIRKISRILKRGDYQEIHLNVNDGRLIKLDVTDIVKIKNN